MRYRLPVSVGILVFSVLSIWITSNWKPIYLVFATITIWTSYFINKGANLTISLAILTLIYGGYFIVVLRHKSKSAITKGLTFILALALFFTSVYSINWWSLTYNDEQVLKMFWSVHPEYILILTIAHITVLFEPNNRNAVWPLFLNPINILNPMPWPQELKKINPDPIFQYQLWITGLWDIFLSQILFMILLSFFTLTSSIQTPHFLWSPLLMYIPFLIIINAVSIFAQGTTRMFGIGTPDITDFLFLPRIPSEVWQRSSRLVYNLVYQGVYIPCFRLTKKVWLATASSLCFSFLGMFLFHQIFVLGFNKYFFPTLSSKPWTPLPMFLFAFIWGLWWMSLFGLSHKIKPWIYRSPLHQWIGIVGTHFLSAYGFSLCYGYLPSRAIGILRQLGVSL
jgi:hypothetical protein